MVDLLNIKDPSFIKSLSKKELKELAKQIREFLIENISKTGGHLSSNLGVVEITIAMYYVFDPEKDKFLFDVGHQSYVHKILTGRAKDFTSLRQWNGLSGYIDKRESKYDVWESGHAATTISAMSGMLIADNNEKVVTLIGDSSIVNGVSLEGLNFLGANKNLSPIIILNDNKMGISKSVGALSKSLSRLQGNGIWSNTKKFLDFISPICVSNFFHKVKVFLKKIISRLNLFEDMGFDYYGPINGNNICACIRALKRIKNKKGPVMVHVLTQKGKGYALSEQDESGNYHGVSPFDIKTGKPLVEHKENSYSYSQIIAKYLFNKRREEQFYVVTPAMKAGAKLEEFASKYKEDFFDVGIAEEHAAIMSAGIALKGKKVVLLYYSTFAQRAYDYLLNDICRQNLSVIIGIDRAGVVGEDGQTHQGIYDVSMFASMPNMVITMPKDASEAVGLFNYAFIHNGPIAVRYPKSNVIVDLDKIDYKNIIYPSWEEVIIGSNTCVITYGSDVLRIEKIIKDNGLNIGLVNARFINILDNDLLIKLFNKYNKFVVVEQVVSKGTLYHLLLEYDKINNFNKKISSISFDSNDIIDHGSINDVLNNYGLGNQDILKEITK